jgi:6-phosphogluconolactonase
MTLTRRFNDSRRRPLQGLLALVAALVLAPPTIPAAQYWLYVGTYNGKNSKGIYVSRFDSAAGRLGEVRLAAEARDPSFLAVHPGGGFLYAVNEVGEFQGQAGGGVSAFAVNRSTGDLRALNQQSTRGVAPCHLSVDPSGHAVLVANYMGGSIASFPIGADGSLSPAITFVQHRGKGPNPQRQEGPHAHAIYLDEGNRHAVVADLGLDQLLVYRFDSKTGALQPNTPASFALKPGAGPRHLAFAPGGRRAYCISEMHSTLTALSYDPSRGEFRELQTVSTLPEAYKGDSSTAEVAVHPSGRFVYGSNRGHDSIAVFSVERGSGRLTLVQHQLIGGRTPRGFAIDPTGRWLLAGNQGSDQITVFQIDSRTGTLTPSGAPVSVGSPVSLVFARVQ